MLRERRLSRGQDVLRFRQRFRWLVRVQYRPLIPFCPHLPQGVSGRQKRIPH